jgi:hypothetical protein
MNYRPITDMWLLARAKLKNDKKYYGAYLGGFPERARALLGATINEPVLHVCGGMARHYPYKAGFGPNDKTLDIDPLVEPDYTQDALLPLPSGFKAILIDPPYSEEDSKNYTYSNYPKPNELLKNAINSVGDGCRVGIIHYILPMPPKNAKFIACIGIICGFNNRIRCYSVFERKEEK